VFFKLANHKIVGVKVAPCIKVPYVKGRVNIYKTDLNHYNNTYNTIYYAEKGEYRTYFYLKNNSFKYYNSIRKPLFMIDVVNEKYKIIELNNANYVNNDSKSLVIVTEQGKQYLVSNEVEYEDEGKYLAIIDIINNKEIYMEKLDEEDYLYFSFIRPIGNSIVPIIGITDEYIGVELVDLSSNQHHRASWFLTQIQAVLLEELTENHDEEDLPEDLVEILKDDSMEHISHIEVEKIQYEYASYENNVNYIKKATFLFMFKTYVGDYECEFYNMSLNMVLDLNKHDLEVYLDFSKTSITINASYNIKLIDFLNNKKLLSKRVSFSGNVYKNNISDILYSNNCCVILHAMNGIAIVRTTKDGDNSSDIPRVSALYRYKHYLFIFRRGVDRDLIIVNTKSNSIAVWSSNANRTELDPELTYRFYYLSRIHAFLFIHTKRGYILLVNRASIDKFLSQDSKCYENTNDIISFFDLNSAIFSFINKCYRGRSVKMGSLIGHYVSRESSLLYAIASYNIDQTKHVGLFECKIAANVINVNLLDFASLNRIRGSKYRRNIDVANIQLYKIREFSLKDLELAYGSNDKIISIGHNRQSVSLQTFLEENPKEYIIKQRNVFQCNKSIILEHVVREKTKLDYIIWFSFIISELCVVDKWEV